VISADRVLLLAGLALALLALSSRIGKRFSLSPVLLALGAGMLVGPHVLWLVEPESVVERGKLLEQLARVVLALAVFDIALRTEPPDLRRNAGRIGILLLVVMPGMWLVTPLGAGALLGLPLASALVLGAALTPTDPGVASALVTGVLPDRLLPRGVRMSLQVEAGGQRRPGPSVGALRLPAGHPSGRRGGRPLDRRGRAAAGHGRRRRGRRRCSHAPAHRRGRRAPPGRGGLLPAGQHRRSLAVLALAHILGGTGVLAAFLAGLIFSEGLPEGLRQPIHTVHRSATKVALTVLFLAFGTVLPFDR